MFALVFGSMDGINGWHQRMASALYRCLSPTLLLYSLIFPSLQIKSINLIYEVISVYNVYMLVIYTLLNHIDNKLE